MVSYCLGVVRRHRHLAEALRQHFVSAPNKSSEEEETVNKKCETLPALAFRFDRFGWRDGYFTWEKLSMYSFLHHTSVRRIFSMGKCLLTPLFS